MKQTIKTCADIAKINATAREARRLCTDIIRQTQPTAYYGKVGAAWLYADDSRSATQLANIAAAVEHLAQANELLFNIAADGGLTQAAIAIEQAGTDDGQPKFCQK